MKLPGYELYWDDSLGRAERWYCRLFGVPIVGLRIRLRRILKLLPPTAHSILDAGSGRGVIARTLAQRYAQARVDAIDEVADLQAVNNRLAAAMGLDKCRFFCADLLDYRAPERYDLIVSVDNLEHIADDHKVLENFFVSLREGGLLLVHVPHYYRRWPLLRWQVNFDIPGHVRPGYHLPELTERTRAAGFTVERAGFSYGFIETLANNLSYRISAGRQSNRAVYALLFPLLNAIAWLGQWSWPAMGAGVWVVARKPLVAQGTACRGDGEADPERDPGEADGLWERSLSTAVRL